MKKKKKTEMSIYDPIPISRLRFAISYRVLPHFFGTANRPVSIVQFLTRRVIDWNWKRRRMASGKRRLSPGNQS